MKKTVSFVISLVLIMSMTGCGLTSQQIIETQSFGAATSNIGYFGEEEFVNIRNGIIRMNRALVAIDNTKKANSVKFDRPTSAEATAARVAAARALRLYGELLVELVSEDRSENLQSAANALVNNTTAALHKELSEDRKKVLNQIIVGLGTFWINHKKATVAKAIIPAYEQPVNALADLLSEDFSLEDGALGFLKAYDTTAKRLKNAAIQLVNAGDKYSVLEREKAVHALVLSENAITRAKEINTFANTAINDLKNANTELVKAINEKPYSTADIKAYAKQIQQLVNVYQVLAN